MNDETVPDIVKIYTLSIDCVYNTNFDDKEWIRVIEIPDFYSLDHLHLYIQHIIDFDADHLYDFFAGRDCWTKKIEYSTAIDRDQSIDNYSKITLKEIYPLGSLKLCYLFDYGDTWYFEIKRRRGIKNPVKGFTYPRVIEEQGKNPEQYGYKD